MMLVLNIGNTNCTAGLFSGSDLHKTITKPTSGIKNETAAAEIIRKLLIGSGRARGTLPDSVISSVVPVQTRVWAEILRKETAKRPLVIRGSLPLPITIHYADPSTLGADRLCACVAAHQLFGGPAIVVDFGTATTYNLIDKNGNFLGGAIAPGMMTAARALSGGTAQLPNVRFSMPVSFPGTSTRACLEAGIFYSGIDAAEGMIRRIWKSAGMKLKVIVTGGLSETIQPFLSIRSIVEKNLVLHGARIIHQWQAPEQK